MTRHLTAIAVVASAMGIGVFAGCSKSNSASSESRSANVERGSASLVNRSNSLDPPVRLCVNDAPLNSEAKKMFPSPTIYDVDGDGAQELVVGDLMGGVGVYKNLNNSGAGDPVWSSRKNLTDSEGNQIQSANW